ncbi:MAG TPA: ACT domain-containing protein, partial [Desulfobacteraceae bacterium]|nr:ACT domain-containing protein [Desulfobacteraceae bacterium]
MSEVVLINITGRDRMGLDAKFTGILAQYSANVLDIGQAVIHEHISLGILVEIPREEDFAAIFKDMLFESHNMGLSIDFKPVDQNHYENWAEARASERRIITLLGKKLTARQISSVISVIAENNLNIEGIHRLTGRVALKPSHN